MRRLAIIIAVLALVPVVSASAGTVFETWNGTGGLTVHLTGHADIGTQSGWATIKVTNDTGMSPLVAGTSYEAYCVDLLHWSGGTDAVTDSFLDWDLYSGAHGVAAASYLMNTYLGKAGTDRSSLQIAIWEVLYEKEATWNAGSGNVWFSTFNATNVGAYLADAAAHPDYAGNAVWIRVTDDTSSDHYQDFATVASVPDLGSSVLLLGIGLAGLTAFKRRRG
jgi:hypothetical protein